MKKIYLLSGPGAKEGFSKEVLCNLKKDLINAKSITFIASSPENHEKNLNYVFGNENITGMINHLKTITTFSKINIIDNENKNLDLNSDIIYLLGGNHETQLNFIKENNLGEKLQKYNGILLCTSCGAMNVAKYGYYSKDDDIKESFFYKGLNLIDVTVDPHFDIENKEQTNEAKRMSYEHQIYGVPNASCITLENNNIEMIGKIYVFNKGKMVIFNEKNKC